MESEQEGMSTPKKVVAGAAVGVAIPAAVGVAKKILGDDSDQDPETASGAESQSQSAAGGSQSSRQSQSRSSSGRRSRSKGRSKASKSQRSSSSTSRGSSTKVRSGTSSRSNSCRSTAKTRNGPCGPRRTKEQLYATATRLKSDGRSKMSKQQLERARANARRYPDAV